MWLTARVKRHVALGALTSVVATALLLAACAAPTTDPPPAETVPSTAASDTEETVADEEPAATPEPVVEDDPEDGGAVTDCTAVDPSVATDLLGAQAEGPTPGNVGNGNLPLGVCRWQGDGGSWIQVADLPAGDWARQLPALVAGVEASGLVDDEENTARLREAADLVASGATIEPAEACELFSAMLEVAGHPGGSAYTVNIVPTAENPQALSGQACVDGTYTSVLLVREDLSGSADEVSAVADALSRVVGTDVTATS